MGTGWEARADSRRRLPEVWPHLEAAWQRLAGLEAGWPKPESAEWWLSNFASALPHLLTGGLAAVQRLPLLDRALLAARRQHDRNAEGAHLASLGETWL